MKHIIILLLAGLVCTSGRADGPTIRKATQAEVNAGAAVGAYVAPDTLAAKPSGGGGVASGVNSAQIITNCMQIVVAGAGTSEFNGTYTWNGANYTNASSVNASNHYAGTLTGWAFVLAEGGFPFTFYTNGSTDVTASYGKTAQVDATNPPPTVTTGMCSYTTNTVTISNGVVAVNGVVLSGGMTNDTTKQAASGVLTNLASVTTWVEVTNTSGGLSFSNTISGQVVFTLATNGNLSIGGGQMTAASYNGTNGQFIINPGIIRVNGDVMMAYGTTFTATGLTPLMSGVAEVQYLREGGIYAGGSESSAGSMSLQLLTNVLTIYSPATVLNDVTIRSNNLFYGLMLDSCKIVLGKFNVSKNNQLAYALDTGTIAQKSSPLKTHNIAAIFGTLSITNNQNLTLLDFHSLGRAGSGSIIASNPALQFIDLSSFDFQCPIITNHPALTSLGLTNFNATAGLFSFDINWANNAFNATTVNAILHALVTGNDGSGDQWGQNGETVTLSGGTSASPTGTGITDKATLEGRGATVNVN